MIDVVMITTGERRNLLQQSMSSLINNVSDSTIYRSTIVVDRPKTVFDELPFDKVIINRDPQGASASRNIGAGSVPKYRRGRYVCFLDDDVYMMPGWDRALLDLAERLPKCIVSGHAHPYNGSETMYKGLIDGARVLQPIRFEAPLVISTVNIMMPWSLWDDVGYFCEPGGPGGSEDYDYCMRAKDKGYGFAVTEPNCIVHCGLTSSSGKRIVGYEEMMAKNERLVGKSGEKGVVYE